MNMVVREFFFLKSFPFQNQAQGRCGFELLGVPSTIWTPGFGEVYLDTGSPFH
jgi:hypothetical protein